MYFSIQWLFLQHRKWQSNAHQTVFNRNRYKFAQNMVQINILQCIKCMCRFLGFLLVWLNIHVSYWSTERDCRNVQSDTVKESNSSVCGLTVINAARLYKSLSHYSFAQAVQRRGMIKKKKKKVCNDFLH